jgi:imidazolonepropionase-like amidohydrolase
MKAVKCVLMGVASCLIIVGFSLFYTFELPASPKPFSSDVALRNVTIINPLIDKTKVASLTVQNGSLEISDQNIGSVKYLNRYSGSFVLPGLINMHSHSPSKNLLNLGPMFSLAAIMHGVTTWRDAIDADSTGVPALREQIEEGQWPTPEVVACALITRGKTRWPNSNILNQARDAKELVKSLKRRGYGCIKSYEHLGVDIIAAIKKAATSEDMQVIGHVPQGLLIEQALLPDTQHFFGVQEKLQHGVIDRNGDWTSVDTSRINEVAEFITKKGMINTPTLVTLKQIQEYGDYQSALVNENYQYIPRFYPEIVWNPINGLPVYRNLNPDVILKAKDALGKKQVLVKLLHDKGATLNIGTDTQQPFVVPGIAMWQEMHLFEEAGLTPEEVWAHATWKAQRQLPEKSNGLLETGSEATFLIFSEDPTLSLDALGSLEAVVLRGHLYDLDELKESMTALQTHYESGPVKFLSGFFVAHAMTKIAKKFTH